MNILTTDSYQIITAPISYACEALNTLPHVEAVFGTKHMGPFTQDILRNHPHWQAQQIIMPIESEGIGGTCHMIHRDSHRRPYANGLVTNVPGLVIVGYGADCPGVLAASEDGSVVGMFHAAWWAQADNGIEKFTRSFAAFGIHPHQIHATIGPCIAAEHYHVQMNDYFQDTLERQKPLMVQFLDTDTCCFDTRASTEALLREQGIMHITHMKQDTYADYDENNEYLFYSARRGRPVNHNNPWAIRIEPH